MEDNQVQTEVVNDTQDGENQTAVDLPASTAGMTSIEKQLYKIIIDGQESEVDIEELKKGYGSNKASQQRFNDAAKTKQEAQQALKMLMEDPRAVLKQLGMNPREVAETMLALELDEITMDPKDKELRDLRAKFDKQQREEEEAKKKYEDEYEAEQVQKHLDNITGEMTEVLDELGFEPSPYSAERFRYYMQAALNAGHVIRPRDCVEYVVKDIKAEIRSMTGGKDIAKLVELFGEDLVKKLAKSTVDSGKKEKVIPRSENIPPTRKENKSAKSPKEYFKELERSLRG